MLLEQGSEGYSAAKMTYDLRRLLLNGIVHRVEGKNTYMVTPKGRRVAPFFVKTFTRVLKHTPSRLGACPADGPPALRSAWHALDRAVDSCLAQARVAA